MPIRAHATDAEDLAFAVGRLRQVLDAIGRRNSWESWELGLASDGTLSLDFAGAEDEGNYTLDPEPSLSDWEDLIELTHVNL